MKVRYLHIILWLLLGCQAFAQPQVYRGEVDVRSYDFSKGSIALTGEWEFYWNTLYHPDTRTPAAYENPSYSEFLEPWSTYTQPAHFFSPQFGYATYRLILKTDEQTPDLSLYIPLFYSSYELYINGEGVENNGHPDTSKATSSPNWRPSAKALNLKPGKNEILLLVSNFDHHKGGTYKPLLLGTSSQINVRRNFGIGASFFLAGCLLIAGAIAFGLFWFNRKDYSGLFFSLFCIAYTYRALGTDEYVINAVFDGISWSFALRLEYGSLYLSVIFYTYFVKNLVTNKIPSWAYHTVATVSALAFATLVLPPHLFTSFMDFYLAFLGITMVYIAIVSLLTIDFSHKMSWLTISGALLLTLVIFLKFGVQLKLIPELIWLDFVGYILFIFTQAIALIIRFGRNLRETTTAAGVASKSRAEFLNTMSHELRTPMNAILGMSDFLAQTELTASQKDKVQTIQKNGESLLAIILDILSISELESGKITLEKKPLNIEECLRGVVNLALKEKANKPIDLEIKVDPDIPDRLIGDATRLKQIFMNLVGNAFKFTEKGKVSVTGEMVGATENGIELRFKVKDTGIGMASSRLRGITKAFKQAEEGNTRKYGGIGLGLSVVKDLVAQMQGTFAIQSEKGKGTTVELTFSLELPKLNLRQEEVSTVANPREIDKNLKILYAEDNPVNQKLLVMMMKTFGLDIDVAENGKVAWHKALEKNYNIILMDLQMPEMDGFEATRRIIEDVRTRPIIIAVTANASGSDRKKCFESGMNDFISKPIKADVLKQGIIKWQGLRKYLDEGDEHSKYLDIKV
jgi:signal transduction histidine kinase/ActR/RegA family two-component response regulator